MEFRRKLYARGGSFETTIPKPLLFDTQDDRRYEVVFTYDPTRREWGVRIEEVKE